MPLHDGNGLSHASVERDTYYGGHGHAVGDAASPYEEDFISMQMTHHG